MTSTDGVVAYTIPAPFMEDSSAPEATSSSVATRLTETGSGWDLAVTPDYAWLSDPSRVYPVDVDPTVTPTTADSGSRDCWIGNADTSASHCTADDAALYVWAGTDDNTASTKVRRSLFKFDLSSVPDGVDITDASLQLYLDSTRTRGSTAPVDYVARRLTMGWSNNATWVKNSAGSQPTDFWTTPGAGDDTDIKIGTTALGGGSTGWKSWDLSLGTVRGWYDGSIPNYGLLLKQDGGENDNNEIAFKSGDSGSGKYPKLVITYNTPPTRPGSLGVSPCIDDCTPASTSTLTPTLSATSADRDGGSLTYTFHLTTSSGSAVATGTDTAAAGSPATWTVPAGKLDDDSSYQFTVSVTDGTDTAGPSGAFSFTTNTDKPPAVPTGFNETPCKPTLCADKVPAGTPPKVLSVSPVLSAKLSDPDTPLGSLYGDFQVRAVGTTTNLAVGSAQPDPNTGIWSFTVPAGVLSDGGHYEFRVGDRDATSTTWSDWVAFDVAVDKIATVPSVSMSPCLSTCGSWVTDTTVPNFTATSDDADDSTISYHFEIQNPDGTSVTTGKVGDVKPGQPVSWKTSVGKLSAGNYQIRVGAADDVQEGDDAISWTTFTPFTVQYPTHTPTDITSCPAITTHVTWTQAGSPYILHCTETVKTGGDLEIQPGTVVKMAGGRIDVQDGQLDAHGSADYPIFFTSYADDTQLGDTNGDGDSTSPAPGDWSTAITIGDISDEDAASSTAESTVKNVAFTYGGRNGGGYGGGCHGAGQVIHVDRWGRVTVSHDDFAQLQCNAFSVDEQSDGIGTVVIKNSYVEPTVYAAFDQVMSGVIKDNVLDSPTTMDTWTGSTTWGLTMTGNYMVGNMRIESSGARPDILGMHDNSLFMNGQAQEPWGINNMDERNNWWGFVPKP
ncbi:MAG TPA: DNRLRE domain-containing protein, partial [Nocardioides sp.]|nr:DNRLRE domain-containing protein [Nocardioides sp.]